MSRHAWVASALWVLCLLQFVTVRARAPLTLVAPPALELRALTVLFVATSVVWIGRWRRRGLVGLHLATVAALFALHPFTLFGRDGSLVVVGVYLVFALHHLSAVRSQVALSVAISLAGLLLVETLLSVVAKAPAATDLLDYGDLIGAYHRGGFLRPDLDVAVVGERGPVRFVTNSVGFRDRREIEIPKPAGTSRALLLGDSFVAGYRVDQDETVGRLLEGRLRRTTGLPVEVWTVGVGHPGAAVGFLRDHASAYEADLIVVGVTLGNDVAQSYGARAGLGFEEGPLATAKLPEMAFVSDYRQRLPLRIHRTLKSWRSYRRLARLGRGEAIASWYHDAPGSVHLFDAVHGLGLHYARSPLALVEAAQAALAADLAALRDAADRLGAELVVVLFPQRYQSSPADQRATVFAYALAPDAFAFAAASHRIADACRRLGVEHLDLLAAFSAGDAAGDYLPGGDMHWSARGHARAAAAIAAFLTARRGAVELGGTRAVGVAD